jgi:putative FmdB family regulatory protein
MIIRNRAPGRTPVPTYQYACTECGHSFEQFQSFTDDALTECPTCGGRLRKVFNSVGIVFKGSGFYRNDSREAAKKDGADKAGSLAKDKGGKSESAGGGSSEAAGSAAGGKSDSGSAGSDKGSSSSGASSSSGGSSSSSGSSSGSSGSSGSSTAGSAA